MRIIVPCVSSVLLTVRVFLFAFPLASPVTYHTPQTLIVELCAGHETQKYTNTEERTH